MTIATTEGHTKLTSLLIDKSKGTANLPTELEFSVLGQIVEGEKSEKLLN